MAMERSVGINLPEEAPTTNRRAFGYRVVASILEISLGDRRSWTVDEMEGGTLRPAMAAEQELRLKDFEDTRWVLHRDESPVAALDNFGFLEIEGRLVDLQARYQELNRKLYSLTMDVFRGVLP